jgi:hypothetical protein
VEVTVADLRVVTAAGSRVVMCPARTGVVIFEGPHSRIRLRADVPKHGLRTLIHMHVLDPNEL